MNVHVAEEPQILIFKKYRLSMIFHPEQSNFFYYYYFLLDLGHVPGKKLTALSSKVVFLEWSEDKFVS